MATPLVHPVPLEPARDRGIAKKPTLVEFIVALALACLAAAVVAFNATFTSAAVGREAVALIVGWAVALPVPFIRRVPQIRLQYVAPSELWRPGAVLVGSGAAMLSGGAALLLLGDRPSSWTAATLVAGSRPVLEVFLTERDRPRLDSVDVFRASAGTWLIIVGIVATSLARHGSVPAGSLAVATCGALLLFYGLLCERRRAGWLRAMAEGKDDHWGIEMRAADPSRAPLLDAENAGAMDSISHLIFWSSGRRREASDGHGYRTARSEAAPEVVGVIARGAGARGRGQLSALWTLAVVASSMALPLLWSAFGSAAAATTTTLAALAVVVRTSWSNEKDSG